MDFDPVKLQNLISEDLGDDDSFVAEHLKKNILKKFTVSSTDADQRAVILFLEMNARADSFNIDTSDPEVRDCVEFLKHRLWSIFYSGVDQAPVLTLRSCLDFGGTGPGSSVATKHTDFFRKLFQGRLSTTCIGLYKLYKHTVSDRWRRAEEIRSAFYQVDVVEGSNLSTVPKTKDISRTIATEPSLNMFYQLGAGAVIEMLLRRFYGINLRTQPDINRGLAKVGSVTGEYATIDLKSASDTISLKLCELILPTSVYELLCHIRSESTQIMGKRVKLEMMASMGNGFMFPLQTLIFSVISEYVYRSQGLRTKPQVFGDDIICRNTVYVDMIRVLTKLGCIVNEDKSFNDGPFRESCGHDYVSGVNVRSVYIRRCNNEADVFSAINRLIRWCALHRKTLFRSISYLWSLA